MAESGDDFLSRWSRRKRERAAAQAPEPDAETVAAERAPAAPGSGGDAALTDEEAARRQALIDRLPDIDTLDESSDFTAFLQDGVPEELKRRALRRLWRLNPVFANLDGLNDYDDDFTDAATVVQGLKSLYQVGKGMVAPEAEEPDEAAPAEAAEAAKAADPERASDAEEAGSPPDRPDQLAHAAPEGDCHPENPAVAPAPTKAPTAAAPVPPKRPGAARRRWRRFET